MFQYELRDNFYMEIRFHIMQFSTVMEDRMRKHDKEKGTHGWVDMNPKDLLEKMMGKVLDLSDLLMNYPEMDHEKIISKCADTANYSMMIADIARRKIHE